MRNPELSGVGNVRTRYRIAVPATVQLVAMHFTLAMGVQVFIDNEK